jgi:magnesium transporter
LSHHEIPLKPVVSTKGTGRSHYQAIRPKRRSGPGAAPGVLTAHPEAVATRIDLIAYGPDGVDERANVSVTEIAAARAVHAVTWVNVVGLADVPAIERLGEYFGLHRLALEDVINVHQRAKTEEYDGHIYLVARMVRPDHGLDSEQVSMFLGGNFVLTFQEHPGDCFEPIRTRVRTAGTRIREAGPDYLVYALVDAVIDGYFPAIEKVSDRLEQLEDDVVQRPEGSVVERLHAMKHELLALRRAIWPHREMVNSLLRHESSLVSAQTGLYLRDCSDHTIQLMDIVETYREIASGLMDVYLSSLSHRMNEIMKVLTIIATIFMPLAFIVGLYGMNFDRGASPWNMPELGWRFGYPLVLGVMILSTLGMLYYFRRKRWLGGARRDRSTKETR